MAAPTPTPRRELDPDTLAALEEQRDFLLASIADLDREHAAGDLSDDDARELRDDYTARAAEVIRSIDARERRTSPIRGGRITTSLTLPQAAITRSAR